MNPKVMLADGTVIAGNPVPMTLSGSNIWSATMWPPDTLVFQMEILLLRITC